MTETLGLLAFSQKLSLKVSSFYMMVEDSRAYHLGMVPYFKNSYSGLISGLSMD